MSLLRLVHIPTTRPRHQAAPRKTTNVLIAPSDEEVCRIMKRARVIMKDGPFDVEGKLIGWPPSSVHRGNHAPFAGPPRKTWKVSQTT
mgnify:CR=1 FL=1